MAALRFPREHQQDYPGVIEFYKVTVEPPELRLGGLSGLIASAVTTGEESESPTVDQFDQDVGKGDDFKASRTVESSPSVKLYLPQAVSFRDGINYDNNVELGIIGGAINRELSNSSSLSRAVREGVVNGYMSFQQMFTEVDNPEIARIALARAPLPSTFGEPIRNALRVSVNPNRKTVFRDVRAREFTFQFKMIANSPREAQEIEDIIKYFRTHMYPEVLGDFRAAYAYPDMFKIKMKYNGQKVGYNIWDSFLTSFEVVLNPSSMGWHADGKPSEVDINMTFFEERPLDRADIEGGY